MQLNGKQTIYQMIRLAEEVAKRRGTPAEPAVYKRQYYDPWKRQRLIGVGLADGPRRTAMRPDG